MYIEPAAYSLTIHCLFGINSKLETIMAVHSNIDNDIGNQAPAFRLPTANPWIDSFDGPNRSMEDYPAAKVFVNIFTCNHCPYAVHVQDALVALAKDYADKGVQFIAISANDPVAYPADSFEAMTARAREIEMPFPYLFDESQEIARAYGAACTPDFFVCDREGKMFYRGRFDETRPGMGVAHGGDLKAALDAFLEDGRILADQIPSMGCSIKWKS